MWAFSRLLVASHYRSWTVNECGFILGAKIKDNGSEKGASPDVKIRMILLKNPMSILASEKGFIVTET